jgi:hypothetical protein
MFGKKYMYKRSVMIAVAVIALMTLTAGVAAAASMKAHKIAASGEVTEVGLRLGSTVGSKFKIKDDIIKSVKITTVGEYVEGDISDWINCEEKGKHGEGACAKALAILDGADVDSTHTSKAKFDVIAHLPPGAVGANDALMGTLKGSLKAALTITGANAEELTGKAKLKIRSVEGAPSIYQCLIGVDPAIFGTPADPAPMFGDIQDCIDSPGPNALGLFVPPVGPYAPFAPFGGTYIDLVGNPIDGPANGFGPVLVPVVLHVEDNGTFTVKSDDSKIKGKISVTVHSTAGDLTGSTLSISKTKATFAAD